MNTAPAYIFEANEKPSLPLHHVPLLEATEENLEGYGCLVDDAEGFEIEIVRWPAPGWRPVDEGTGDEGGVVEGIFHGIWTGDVLTGRNEAVGGHYVLGWSRDPQTACAEQATAPRDQVLLWHMNYRPYAHFIPSHAVQFLVKKQGACARAVLCCCTSPHATA